MKKKVVVAVLAVVLAVGVLAYMERGAPKTIECPVCGSTAVKGAPGGMNGVLMYQYMCPNQHITFRKQ